VSVKNDVIFPFYFFLPRKNKGAIYFKIIPHSVSTKKIQQMLERQDKKKTYRTVVRVKLEKYDYRVCGIFSIYPVLK